MPEGRERALAFRPASLAEGRGSGRLRGHCRCVGFVHRVAGLCGPLFDGRRRASDADTRRWLGRHTGRPEHDPREIRSRERLILLEQGQARFDVAQDPTRPFRVKAGAETVIALGTQFNIELVAHSVLVTLIEGRVAVLPGDVPWSDVSPRIDLTAGEGVQVRQDGKTVRLPRVDVAHVTAWQSGKVFFDNEPLASAAERINRYASERILVDPSAANIGISGVFNAGDARAFIEAVTAYFPVKAAQTGGATVRLTARDP